MAEKRFSQQREQIYQVVCDSKEHPTAQMVYDALREELPKLSLGTVYRNLHQMAENGRLQELEGVVVRYDADLNRHTHARCLHCGRVLDLKMPYDATLDLAAEEDGWNISGHGLIFSGMCPACAGKV